MIITKDKSFYKSLFLLALPIALQNLITFAISFADNVMISSLGDNAVSGVFMGNQIQTLLQFLMGGVEGAILVLAAQYYGKGDGNSVRNIAAIGIRIGAILGFLTTLVCAIFPRGVISIFTNKAEIIDTGAEYLGIVCFSFVFFCITQALIAAERSVECARVGLYVSLASLVINVVLNYILIFGKLGFSPMGIRGAAIATLVSRVTETLIISVYALSIDKKLKIKLSDFIKLDRQLLRDFIKYGAPLVAGQIVWSINTLSQSAIMGRLSEDGVVAALSVANTMHNLAYVTMTGMSNAVGIITGKTIGAGEEKKMREYAKTVQVIFVALGLITGGTLHLLKQPFISLYSNLSSSAIAISHTLINVLSVTIIGTCYQAACLFGLVKSGGEVDFVFKNDCIFVFFIVLPSAIAASFLGAPPWVVFACLKCDQVLKCAVAAVKINRFNWMKNLTRGNKPPKTAEA